MGCAFSLWAECNGIAQLNMSLDNFDNLRVNTDCVIEEIKNDEEWKTQTSTKARNQSHPGHARKSRGQAKVPLKAKAPTNYPHTSPSGNSNPASLETK